MTKSKHTINRKAPIMEEELAKAACEYSRSFILEGATQLVNNSYDALQRKWLRDAVRDMRALCKEESQYRLEMNSALNQFHQSISLSKKLSLGNCSEMAKMALDYVLLHAPSVNAEIYRIDGGDHNFLVIGREKNSSPYHPSTWGENAYICDPWSNKVYPAYQYLSELKNYYNSSKGDGDYQNFIENFNSAKHFLKPRPEFSTQNLKRRNSRAHLDSIIEIYQQKMNITLEALKQLEDNLQTIIDRLENDYPDNSEKRDIIQQVNDELRSNIEKISKDIEEDYNQLDYDQLRSTAEASLEKSVNFYRKAASTLVKNETTLGKYKDEQSLVARTMRFFKIPPKTLRQTNEALGDTANKLKNNFKNN